MKISSRVQTMNRRVIPFLFLLLGFLVLAPAAASAAPDPSTMIFDPATRAEALSILHRMSAKRADATITKIFANTGSDREAQRILVEILGDAGKMGKRNLKKIASGDDTILAEMAYKALIAHGHSRELSANMLVRLRPGQPVRLALLALEQLQFQRHPELRGWLEKIIPSEERPLELRIEAVHALSEMDGEEATRFLNLVYNRSKLGYTPRHLRLRRVIIDALAKLGSIDSIPTLIDALRIKELQHHSVNALVQMGEKVVPRLQLVMKTADPRVEPGVLAVLFRLGRIEPARFIKMLRSSDTDVREKAKWILISFPDERIVPTLLSMWESGEAYPTRMELIDLLLSHYGNPTVVSLFKRMLSGPDPAIRSRALEVIVGTQDLRARKTIVAMLEEEPLPELRIQALRAAVFLGLTEGRKDIEKMIQYEPADVRKVAIWALGWLGDGHTTPAVLAKTRGQRDADIRPVVVETAARLSGTLVRKNAEASHYSGLKPFNARKTRRKAGTRTYKVTVQHQKVNVVLYGSGKPMLVFSPLPISDPAPVLEGLKGLARKRQLAFFYVDNEEAPPYRVNGLTPIWMREAADKVRKVLRADKKPVDVLGWSLGAVWALDYCAADTSRCSQLVAVSPMSLEADVWKDMTGLIRGMAPSHLSSAVEMLSVKKNEFHPDVWARHYQEMLAHTMVADTRKARALGASGYPLFLVPPEAPCVAEEEKLASLAEQGVPITGVFGSVDPYGVPWRKYLTSLASSYAGTVTVKVVDDGNHYMLHEIPRSARKGVWLHK